MPTPFLNSEEYDERAHKQYDAGDYEGALETLKEGLNLYPHSVELYVGLGYTRLAREEYVWAKHAFDKALVLDPEHDDGMVGLGEVLLRVGRSEEAKSLFDRVRQGPSGLDPELLLSMGRAFYRDQRFEDAKDLFESAVEAYPEDAEATAALAFTLHRLGNERAAVRELQSALSLNPDHHEARIYLAHLLYDQGDWPGALAGFASLSPAEHWDPLAVWRLMELKRTVGGLSPDDPELMVWESRLDELETDDDPIDDLLAEVEAMAAEAEQDDDAPARDERPRGAPRPITQPDAATHRVRLPDGQAFEGTWIEIIRQLRDQSGREDESIAQFMQRWAEDARVRIGVGVPADDAEAFLLAHARAGLLNIER